MIKEMLYVSISLHREINRIRLAGIGYGAYAMYLSSLSLMDHVMAHVMHHFMNNVMDRPMHPCILCSISMYSWKV